MPRLFFSGIGGAGTAPLAQLMRSWGHEVSGSDRAFDHGKQPALRARLDALGIAVVPQDGAGVVPGIERLIYSTAVESTTPELVAARALGIRLQTRPELLAEVVDLGSPGIAIAGTSGKSTVTGMLWWILRESATPATVLCGAALAHEPQGGGFMAGPRGAAVVAEACESDGTLHLYRPAIGVVHSISRDHGEVAEVARQFAAFAGHARTLLVNGASPEARAIARSHPDAVAYGRVSACAHALEVVSPGPMRARGVLELDGAQLEIDLPIPGEHNLDNAAAAACVAHRLGIGAPAIGQALASFPGVARRCEVVGTSADGIRVIDDYAHNGEKIAAAVRAAQLGCERLVAVFQPHGYSPARFLRPELRELLPRLMRPHDRFCYARIFDAGGTVNRDIAAADLAGDLPAPMRVGLAQDHAAVMRWVAEEARPGDTVLLMGARDPDLPRLARAILGLL